MASKGKTSKKRKTLAQKTASRKSSAAASNVLEGFFPTTNNKAMEKIMTQSKSQIDKMAQESANFGKETLEAMIQSATLFAKGFEEISRTAIALAQESAEKQAKFLNQALSSKTLNELAEAQNKIAQANLDDLMSNATKLSELSIKIMTESSEPLNEQMGKSIRKASEAMAA